MSHNIQTSLDWSQVESDLMHQTNGLMYKSDVCAMIKNVQHTITELSEAEVEARHGRPHKARELLAKANQDIELVESYIMVAAIIGKA